MSSKSDDDLAQQDHDEFLVTIEKKARRRRRAQNERHNIWFGLGTFGMVGWSVAIPVVIGILIGSWLDSVMDVAFSWRLTLFTLGVILGCLNAWFWISKERRHVHKEREQRKDD